LKASNKNSLKVNYFFNYKIKYPFNINIFKEKVEFIINNIKTDELITLNEVNISFCNNDEIIKINKKYLSHDYSTDIITFAYAEKYYTDSDVIISLESVKQNAARYGISFRKELFRVIIHGILHICGYNDSKKTEKVLMRKKENYYLKYLK
jgi:rRNA maturation RNase YbeY